MFYKKFFLSLLYNEWYELMFYIWMNFLCVYVFKHLCFDRNIDFWYAKIQIPSKEDLSGL